MDSVLIASSSDKQCAALVRLVKETYPACSVSVAQTGLETRRAATDRSFDCVLLNCPLRDETGVDLAEFISHSTDACCVLITKEENADVLAEKCEDHGTMVIAKPLDRAGFCRALRFVAAARRRMLGVQSENLKLHKKLEEIRTVNRAKLALMQYLGFTEPQAHRYIEKQAMDLRISKNDVARKVIRMYEV